MPKPRAFPGQLTWSIDGGIMADMASVGEWPPSDAERLDIVVSEQRAISALKGSTQGSYSCIITTTVPASSVICVSFFSSQPQPGTISTFPPAIRNVPEMRNTIQGVVTSTANSVISVPSYLADPVSSSCSSVLGT